MSDVPNLLVSVCMITYNQEDYISEAIEGVLMQKTTFPVQLVIGEDFSTDATRSICAEYQKKYPDSIRLLNNASNLGMIGNLKETILSCTGNYIAFCEGDDYWTDPYKLQKQVDFLEANSEFAFCCHRYKRLFTESNAVEDDFQGKLFKNNNQITIDLELFSRYWTTQPLTAVFKKDFLHETMRSVPRYKYFRDVHMFYEILKKANGCGLDFYGGIYRIHSGGVKSGLSTKKHFETSFELFKEIYLLDRTKIIRLQLALCTVNLMRNQKSFSPVVNYLKVPASFSEFIGFSYCLKIELFRELFTVAGRRFKRIFRK